MNEEQVKAKQNSVILTNNQYLYYFPPELYGASSIVNTNWLIDPTESGIQYELVCRAYDHFQNITI